MAFIPAVVLSLPTQFANVWLGAYFEDEATGEASKTMKIGSIVITVVTSKRLFYSLFSKSHYLSITHKAVITFAAYKYIKWEMNKVKPQVIYERRKARYVFSKPSPNSQI